MKKLFMVMIMIFTFGFFVEVVAQPGMGGNIIPNLNVPTETKVPDKPASPLELMRSLTFKLIIKDYFKLPDGKESHKVGSGTAFLINGKIITNFHNIEAKKFRVFPGMDKNPPLKIELKFIRKEIYIEKDKGDSIYYLDIVKTVKLADIAILKLQNEDNLKQQMEWSYDLKIKDVNLGDKIYILGCPAGWEVLLKDAIVSNEDGIDITSPGVTTIDTFMFDALVQWGHSGGPAFVIEDNQIYVVGVVTYSTIEPWLINPKLTPVGLGFAKKTEWYKHLFEDKNGKEKESRT